MFPRVCCLFWAGLLFAQSAPSPQGVARKALDSLLAQKYDDLRPMFSQQAAASPAYSPEALAKSGAEIQSWGTVERIGAPMVRQIANASIVGFTVQFVKAIVTFQFSINEQGQVSGMIRNIDPWHHPSYYKSGAFKDRDITVGQDPYKLPAILSVPTGQGPFPAIVLVHDSGPADIDDTVGAVKIFRDLAEGLASQGVLVLRYEKRTRMYPAVAATRDYTIEKESMEDAEAALALLRTQPEAKPDKVFLLGYGLGGYVAPRIAEADGKLAGIVLLDAYGRPLEDVALDQAKHLQIQGPQMAVITESVAKIKKLTPGDADTPPLLGMTGSYLLDLQGYNPAGEAKLVGVPLLILQGDRDFQATDNDLSAWKAGLAGQKNVTFKNYPALDHVLVAGTGPSQEPDYRRPGQHVSQDVVDDIAKWVQQ